MKTQISIDTYLTQMQPHITYAIKDGNWQARMAGSRGVLLSKEDLAQEARIVLMKAYERYASTVPLEDLYKLGVRCIRNRIQDLCRNMDSVKAGGVGEHVRRGRQAPKAQEIRFYSLIMDTDSEEDTGDDYNMHADPSPSPLENAAVREAVEKIVSSLSVIEQRAVRSMFGPEEFEPQPLNRAKLTRLKARVKQAIREAL